jgi:CubicO group peptidase (beta-lactamase class C family)
VQPFAQFLDYINMNSKLFILFFVLGFVCCKDDDISLTPDPQEETTDLYFPPISGTWEATDASTLGWNSDSINALYSNLESNGSRAFIVLKDGKIVLEKYWGTTLLNNADFTQDSKWYWASAAKTLTGFTIGKAEEDGHLSISNKTSDHLGLGWTSLSEEQEDRITVWHQLTMTSGLDDENGNPDDTAAVNLKYKADPGTRWAYHNAPYTLLESVITSATNEDFTDYFNSSLQDKIGMDGFWQWSNLNHLYLSNARSAARFGLLIQNNGVWEDTRLINKEYINASITPSQELNKAYGYLWWLNGSESYRLPQTQFEFPGKILANAPDDVYSAMGKNGQYVSVSPSTGLVIIRMGDSPDQSLVPLLYLNDIWEMLTNAM